MIGYLSIQIFREFRIIDVIVAIQWWPEFLKTNSEGMFIIRVFVIISATVLIYLVAKAERTEIEI